MPLLKMRNVSEPPRMAVVPRRNEICEMQISQVKMCKDVHFDRACGTFLPSSLYLHHLFSKALEERASVPLLKIFNVAERKTAPNLL